MVLEHSNVFFFCENSVIVFTGDQSPSKIYKEIVEMANKVQNVQDECVEIERENVRYQRKIKRLDEEIQKQSWPLFNEKQNDNH